MSNEKHFLFDWSSLTDEEVIENIKYLQQHYKEYDIRKDGENCIKIISKSSASIVHLSKASFQNKDIFVVNDKFYTPGNIYSLLNDLFYDCKEEIETHEILQKVKKKKEKKDKRRYWWNSNRASVVCYGSSVLLGFVIAIAIVYEDNKAKEIDKKVEQYEKTLPNYQEYKEKVANYRDSLEHAPRQKGN